MKIVDVWVAGGGRAERVVVVMMVVLLLGCEESRGHRDG